MNSHRTEAAANLEVVLEADNRGRELANMFLAEKTAGVGLPG
jgi:hypothetical protein